MDDLTKWLFEQNALVRYNYYPANGTEDGPDEGHYSVFVTLRKYSEHTEFGGSTLLEAIVNASIWLADYNRVDEKWQ